MRYIHFVTVLYKKGILYLVLLEMDENLSNNFSQEECVVGTFLSKEERQIRKINFFRINYNVNIMGY